MKINFGKLTKCVMHLIKLFMIFVNVQLEHLRHDQLCFTKMSQFFCDLVCFPFPPFQSLKGTMIIPGEISSGKITKADMRFSRKFDSSIMTSHFGWANRTLPCKQKQWTNQQQFAFNVSVFRIIIVYFDTGNELKWNSTIFFSKLNLLYNGVTEINSNKKWMQIFEFSFWKCGNFVVKKKW